ncbi:MAG: HAD family hydrolase [Lentimicrobium sp.]|nr:HAD family hydrolase [Lentimicrobium sp.]
MKTNSVNINSSLIKNLIWDFNGTLLNDLGLCVSSINQLLKTRGLNTLTAESYLDIFTFPVQDYYTLAGFDFQKEPYEKVAMEFMELYLSGVKKSPLHENASELLSATHQAGYRQIILSAMESSELNKLAKALQIDKYFEFIFGIDNHMAAGKSHLALQALKVTGFNPEETCLIGDTLHDAHVADEAGVQCILIANGHQSKQKLQSSGNLILNNLEELSGILNFKKVVY